MLKKLKTPLLVLLAVAVVLIAGASLKEKTGMTLLSSTLVIIGDDSDASKIDLYTPPPGKNCIIEYVILREPSGTLAGAVDINFGIGAGTTGSWLDNEDSIVDMDQTDDYMVLERTQHIGVADTQYEHSVIDGDDATANNRTFGIYVVTGATTDAATVTIDVFGYLF